MDVEVGDVRVHGTGELVTLSLHGEQVTMSQGEAAVLGLALTEASKED
ncbi:hypothetical protein [Leucobacter luti]|uniref:Uncharacterized protein n=1 Tax=Leucobacter luti TaxID=340320 RepID=A0A4Q7U044_9MICO|nr:hypothetical protein [Leucobacter luti]RZT66756.1 hypothetical protein EV139_0883 [Leucobacter luti]